MTDPREHVGDWKKCAALLAVESKENQRLKVEVSRLKHIRQIIEVALMKLTRLDELAAENERLRQRLTEMEAKVA